MENVRVQNIVSHLMKVGEEFQKNVYVEEFQEGCGGTVIIL